MKLLLIFLLHLIILCISAGAVSAAATAQFDIWATDCDDSYGNYTSNSTYKSNLDKLITNITTLNIDYGFYNMSAGQKPDQVQAIAMCRGDIKNVTECHSCVSFLKSNLTKTCPIDMGATAYADKCILRYNGGSILSGKWVENPKVKIFSGVDAGGDQDHFANVVEELLMSLPKNAAAGDYRKKFAYGEAIVNATSKVYGLMQCTPELKPSDCLGCLYMNMFYVSEERNQTGAKIIQPSCSLRYELDHKFYDGKSSGSAKKRVNLKTVITSLSAISAAILFLFVMFSIWLFPRQREVNRIKGKFNHYKSLEMDSSLIKDATRNFSSANELGHGRGGGLSKVYKGKLHGKELAVKKIKGSRYLSSDELLSAKLQHTNIVELLGVCLMGNEKLLIFEYVSRGSLDQNLFGEGAELDWGKRYAIIQGIAQGLVYLHRKYRVKIVHCALNAANVFLDQHWQPKITDFGSAMSTDHLLPPKVGDTMACMAPEYLDQGGGIISEKLDVYSFGILVLEILAGRRTKSLHHEEDLISWARRNCNKGTVLEIVDQKIKPATDSAELEMRTCIDIAMSCIHGNAQDRPDMSSVVQSLTSHSAI